MKPIYILISVALFGLTACGGSTPTPEPANNNAGGGVILDLFAINVVLLNGWDS